MKAAMMTMCIRFEESIGCKGLTEKRVDKRMGKMDGRLYGFVRICPKPGLK